LADGGRQEDFVIRWPEDRIPRPGEVRSEAYAAAVSAAALEATAGRRVSANCSASGIQDNVIGVAGRLAGTGGAIADPGLGTNWLIVIPSRARVSDPIDAFDATIREQLTADGNGTRAGKPRRSGPTGRVPHVTAIAPGASFSTTGQVPRHQ
jgi:hypothetical protein